MSAAEEVKSRQLRKTKSEVIRSSEQEAKHSQVYEEGGSKLGQVNEQAKTEDVGNTCISIQLKEEERQNDCSRKQEHRRRHHCSTEDNKKSLRSQKLAKLKQQVKVVKQQLSDKKRRSQEKKKRYLKTDIHQKSVKLKHIRLSHGAAETESQVIQDSSVLSASVVMFVLKLTLYKNNKGSQMKVKQHSQVSNRRRSSSSAEHVIK
ncbi:hypothetical protein GCK72_020657 [Caenorhabditis remanei]|uniref:Uncharacterized protein n=1 Tax=Caenorhabditis remanei TaxID=31234 RepID=A0A6A5GHD2_CAERE|nr:hypothetical protein GCK72_020651 [Caenorhabditis remanei]XP_053582633.1 hypothetical protein GCK72_020657 [Caenorhabditis remanei]KAF1754093.1 hypothetical protein GCK72_020651 [Caenorhabditis remanei]KAF1754099.1 hypothetical protein GCK72_020657 [Caenorhabditis remanei]